MQLPQKSTIFSNETRSADERGEILSIVDCSVSNVSIINCSEGSIRSNHYHNEDFHFMYVLDGAINYFFRDIKSEEISLLKINKGETIFTPPKEWHATHFPVETRLIVSSKNNRDQATYERDTVRETIITKENVQHYIELCSNE